MRVRHTLLAALAVAAVTVLLAAAAAPTPGPWPRSRPEPRVAADEHLDHRHHRQGVAARGGETDSGFPVEYQAHVQNLGWLPWVDAGEQAGTTGKSLRMEAIRIRLGPTAAMFGSVEYRCHVQNLGWLAWTKDGGTCGTTGSPRAWRRCKSASSAHRTHPDPPPRLNRPRRPPRRRRRPSPRPHPPARPRSRSLLTPAWVTRARPSSPPSAHPTCSGSATWGHGLSVGGQHRGPLVRLREISRLAALPARAGEP